MKKLSIVLILFLLAVCFVSAEVGVDETLEDWEKQGITVSEGEEESKGEIVVNWTNPEVEAYERGELEKEDVPQTEVKHFSEAKTKDKLPVIPEIDIYGRVVERASLVDRILSFFKSLLRFH